MNPIPQTTENLMQLMANCPAGGYARTIEEGIVIDTYPSVFPPHSEFSASTELVCAAMKEVHGLKVLDVGTGTGILALVAKKRGARRVDAVDISYKALACAKHNSQLNSLDINIYYSDMFSHVQSKYDLIIANIPILQMDSPSPEYISLFDSGFACHKALFSQSREYLAKEGRILFIHAELDLSFERLEDMIKQHDFSYSYASSIYKQGYDWKCYELRL